jgi:hypothetical protein
MLEFSSLFSSAAGVSSVELQLQQLLLFNRDSSSDSISFSLLQQLNVLRLSCSAESCFSISLRF